MNHFRSILISILIGALLAGASVYFWMNGKIKSQEALQSQLLSQKEDQIEATRNSSLVRLMANVLDLMDDELKANPRRILSDETIERVAALCYSFRPYTHPEGDSLGAKKLSPEKGQLLLAISSMRMDSASLHKIFYEASFRDADLRDADLSNRDLNGIDLNGAYLRGTKLNGANLTGADLSFADLWGANLREAILQTAKLKRANLSWADLSGADLRKADFNEADLISAQLRKADMQYTNLRWTDLSGAFLIETDLDSADMFRAVLKRAQLTKANMHGVNLNNAILSEANLTEVNLSAANMVDMVLSDQYWTELLDGWKVTGAQEIQHKYKVTEGVSYENSKYKLVLSGK